MNETQLPPRKNKSVLFIVLILLLITANGVQFWLSRQDKEVIAEKDIVIKEKIEDLTKASSSLDSMRKELNLKIAEIQRLGGDTASIGLLKRQIERDLKNARRQNFKSKEMIEDLKGRIEDYELQLAAKDAEIIRLKKENQELYADNKQLKTKIVASEDSISKLSQTKAQLSAQIVQASKLRAEDIRISIIDTKGREKEEDDYRAKKIAKLKVSFKVADNKVANIENKEVHMRITDPEGAYLFDAATGGGTFQLDGRESPYTSKLSFLFDNKQPQLSFVWEKGSPWKTGTYTIELFLEGTKMGAANFVVR
jgi:cell division protein ZapB